MTDDTPQKNNRPYAKFYLDMPDSWDVYMRAVYTIVMNFIGMNGACDKSLAIIAKYAGASRDTVRDCLGALVEHKYFDVECHSRKPSIYTLPETSSPQPLDETEEEPSSQQLVASSNEPSSPQQLDEVETSSPQQLDDPQLVAPSNTLKKEELKKEELKKSKSSAEVPSAPHTQNASLSSDRRRIKKPVLQPEEGIPEEEDSLESLRNHLGEVDDLKPKNCLYIAATELADVIGKSWQTLPKERQGGLCRAVKKHAKIYDLETDDLRSMTFLGNMYQHVFGQDGIWYDEYRCKKMRWPFHGKEGDMTPPTEKQITDVWGTDGIKKLMDENLR